MRYAIRFVHNGRIHCCTTDQKDTANMVFEMILHSGIRNVQLWSELKLLR